MSEPILRLEGVAKEFRIGRGGAFGSAGKTHPALRGVNFEVGEGDRVAVVGESGSGKTTLARLLLDLSRPTRGRRTFRGKPFESLSRGERREFRRDCRMVFQNIGAMLNPLMKVREIVEEPLKIHTDWGAPRRAARLEEVMAQVNARPDWLDVYPHRLSGGERRRVSLARALAVRPRVLVADEPVAGLDVVVQVEILDLIDRAVGASGGALVVISHDIAVVRSLCDTFLVMYAGSVVETIQANRGNRPPRHPYSRVLFDAAGILDSRSLERGEMLLPALPGQGYPDTGCAFAPRCALAARHPDRDRCLKRTPSLEPVGPGEAVACHHWRAEA